MFGEMANHTLDDFSFALRPAVDAIRDTNSTFTSLSNRTEHYIKSPRGTVIRIEVLVVVITIMQLFLVMFGSWRRRSRNLFVQKGVFAAYTLSSSLVSYTLGSMQISAVENRMYPIWAISVYILFGCAHSITAYSLSDNSQLTRQVYQSALGYIYALSIAISKDGGQPKSLRTFLGFLPLVLLISMALASGIRRLVACRMASASWGLNKMVADYMYEEHTKSGSSYDPVSMRGYHYIVDSRMYWSQAEIIYIEEVWQNDGGPPLCPDLKDACLSFSLFHLLRRRFFGFECAESLQPKTHDFVFKGLLAKKKSAHGAAGEATIVDYDRVFKVIEVELAFMYDFFFTSYACIYYGAVHGVPQFATAATTIVAIAFLITIGAEWPVSSKRSKVTTVILDTTSADVAITLFILGCIAFLHVVQTLHYWTTIWGRVSFACQRVRGGGRCMLLRELLVRIGVLTSTSSWYDKQEKVGQYSLLESVSNSSNQSMVTKCLALSEYVYGWEPRAPMPYDVWRVIRKPGEHAKLLPAVKKALVQSLERTQGNLTNGESSLSSNGADDLLWACKKRLRMYTQGTSCSQQNDSEVGVILIWHTATCYCETEFAGTNSITEELKEHLEVAKTLSKYTAYLVGFQPKLLPGHHYDTWSAFTVVARQALRQSQGRQPQEETVYSKGLKLGDQLKNMEAARCWKILADFWAEMLLFLAPSDNVKEHVECLAKGGELITQLWALLTHAGILDRPHRNNVANDIENPGEGPSAAPSNCSDTNQQATTMNHPVPMTTEGDVGDTRNSGTTDHSFPGELSYGDALRLRHASSYLDKFAQAAASAACAINKPALRGNSAQWMMVQRRENPVQNVEGTPNASTGPSEIEEIA